MISGDNYFVEESDPASASAREALVKWEPYVLVCGPAFDDGRYGLACGLMSRIAREMGIPAVAAMHPDNTGVLVHGKEMITIPTGIEVTEMAGIAEKLATLALKLGSRVALSPAKQEGYLPTGLRKPVQEEKRGAARAVDMLADYLHGRTFESEIRLGSYEEITSAPPVENLKEKTIALVSSGGIVPRGNPDHQVSSRAEKYYKYSIEGSDELTVDEWLSVHGGFNTTYLNTKDPNYAMPLRYARAFESQGAFKYLHPTFFTTVGTACAVTAAKNMGKGIARELKAESVDAVLMVAT